MSVKTNISLTLQAKEEESNDLGTSRLVHLLQSNLFYPSGAAASQLGIGSIRPLFNLCPWQTSGRDAVCSPLPRRP